MCWSSDFRAPAGWPQWPLTPTTAIIKNRLTNTAKVSYLQLASLFFLFSISIGPPDMGVGQVELAAGIGWETEAQAGLLLKSDLDFKLDLMLTPFR